MFSLQKMELSGVHLCDCNGYCLILAEKKKEVFRRWQLTVDPLMGNFVLITIPLFRRFYRGCINIFAFDKSLTIRSRCI